MAKLYVRKSDGTYVPQQSILVSNLDVVQEKGDSLISVMSQKAVTDELTTKQDTISDLETIREGASLGKTALQKHQDISGLATKEEVAGKQNIIADLDSIRSGAAKGATALQSYTETDPVYIADKPSLATKKELATKQDTITAGNGISIEENVISATADEEDITTNADGKLQFKDRAYGDGMGYVVLRKDKTFAEQVTQANTIYEIRYDFDLGGEALTLPDNITLRYIGGVIKNGTVKGSGLKTMDMPQEQKMLPVFAEGVNFDDNELLASHIGMIEGDNRGSINDDILDQVIASGKNLILDGHYRFNKQHYLDGAISIRGGSLYSKSILFVMREGSSIALEDITISPNSYYIIGAVGYLDYIIDSIIVNRCTFKGEVSLVRFFGADVPYTTQPHGLRRFIVKDSYIECMMSFIVLKDLCVTEEFAFIDNVVRNMKYSLIDLGETNEHTNKHDKTDYWADVHFEKNDIRGAVSTEVGTYLTTIVMDAQKRVFFRDNVVSNLIGTYGQVCYECYASCDEYYCENNVFKNIVDLPSTGTAPDVFPEIFKSKSAGSLRKAYANRWEIDFAECRNLCRNAGIEWTDEAFANISFISLFQFVGSLGILDFCDNTIIIKNGRLRLRQSSFVFTEALFNRNNLDIAEVDSNWNILFPVWGKGIEKINIQYNNFNVHNGNIYLVRGQQTDSFRSVIIEGNTTNFDSLVNVISPGYDLHVKNNKLLRNEKSAFLGHLGLSSENKINGECSYHFPSKQIDFYIGKLTNVSWKYNIEHEPSSSSSITLINTNANIDSKHDYDIIIEADGQKLGYKVRYGDTKMIVYDEWDNIIASSPKNITSSGDWITAYNSPSTKIIFQAQVNLGMTLRIFSLTEDARYRDIHIASPKYGIIQPIIANAYTKGVYRFDSTLGKPVWWNGTKWIDATGADV